MIVHLEGRQQQWEMRTGLVLTHPSLPCALQGRGRAAQNAIIV